jgi:transcriptional regulator with XRE-family HTH domain
MDLHAYLTANNISTAQFAAWLGVSPQAVFRYLSGERVPRRDVLARIAAVTHSQVLPNDFFAVTAPSRRK